MLGLHPQSKHFLNNVRPYITLFQIKSFGAKENYNIKTKRPKMMFIILFNINYDAALL